MRLVAVRRCDDITTPLVPLVTFTRAALVALITIACR